MKTVITLFILTFTCFISLFFVQDTIVFYALLFLTGLFVGHFIAWVRVIDEKHARLIRKRLEREEQLERLGVSEN